MDGAAIEEGLIQIDIVIVRIPAEKGMHAVATCSRYLATTEANSLTLQLNLKTFADTHGYLWVRAPSSTPAAIAS